MTAVCATWKQPDGDHFNGFCTNRFRLTTPPDGVHIDDGCQLCVNPSNPARHTPCCCVAPKRSHRVLELTAVYTGGGGLTCFHSPAFGTFSMFGNDCGFECTEPFIDIATVFPTTCAANSANAAMWTIAAISSSCFDIGADKWMSCYARYWWREFGGATTSIPFTGVIPACNDINGSWVFTNGSFPTWSVVVSSI